MVFPSVPVYLDAPNWNQHEAQQPGGGDGGGDAQQLPPGSAPPPAKPGSMARLAKPPQPEPALKCPRCDSTNTKFCYYNNYSLSQPRHFCKTCRRYWTHGGALRNVPVGGGCRRNKRSKAGGSSSKSQPTTAAATSGGAISATVSGPPQLPFMTSLHHPLDNYNLPNIGLNFAGFQPIEAVDHYQVGGSSSVGLEQWRLQQIQQFPFLGGLETGAQGSVQGLYSFDGDGSGVDGAGFVGHVNGKASSAGLITQMASVKMEDSSRGLNLARQYLGAPRNDQYWSGGGGSGGGGWMTDLSAFNSSSSGNLL